MSRSKNDPQMRTAFKFASSLGRAPVVQTHTHTYMHPFFLEKKTHPSTSANCWILYCSINNDQKTNDDLAMIVQSRFGLFGNLGNDRGAYVHAGVCLGHHTQRLCIVLRQHSRRGLCGLRCNAFEPAVSRPFSPSFFLRFPGNFSLFFTVLPGSQKKRGKKEKE